MDLKSIQNFFKRRHDATDKEKAEFSAQLEAAHDNIITMEALERDFDSMDKAKRKALYEKLEKEATKYPMAVARHDELFNKPFLSLRAKMEYFRGVKRDENGKILRSKEWYADRKALLLTKRADSEARIKNIDEELAGIAKELGE